MEAPIVPRAEVRAGVDYVMYRNIRTALFKLEAERAHNVGMLAARMGQRLPGQLLSRQFGYESDRLHTEVLGLQFQNPLGIAAGFDKNARLLRFWDQIGCGFAEVGSVSARSSRGNPRPRAFRLPDDEALINRMGLNNQGADRIARRISRTPRSLPLAISLAKSHDPSLEGTGAVEDFVYSYRTLAPLADLLVLNLSCPNTAEGKTFEDPNALDDLLTAVARAAGEAGLSVPIFLKLSPPVSERVVLDSEVDEIVAVGKQHGVAGYVAANTDPGREQLKTPSQELGRIGRGGLSGRPLRSKSTGLVRYLFRKTDGRRPIIGVGGVSSGADAYEKIRAGASLVQVYTALVYQGPGIFRQIKVELDRLLEADGFDGVGQAVGLDS